MHDWQGPDAAAVTAQLQAVLDSPHFDASPRSRSFLRFIIEETLAGRQAGLTQAAIATRVFGRRDDFDPTVDPVVRIQAGRLRRSLERYYLLTASRDPVRLQLPRGSYVPKFRWAEPAEAGPTTGVAGEESAPGGWPDVVLDLRAEAAPGFVDHLVLELERYADVRVVLRHDLAGARAPLSRERCFVLSGDATVDHERARVAVRLVDSRSARQVWAEEYNDRLAFHDEFFVQTARIVAARVASEQGVVARTLWGDASLPADDSTYGALLRSYRFFFQRAPQELATTLEALQRATRRDPSSSVAWVQLSRLHVANEAFEIAPAPTSLEQGLACAGNAVRLDPDSQRPRAALAFALLVKGELETGRAEVEAALALNPATLVYVETLGWLLAMLGDWERGLHVVRTAMASNPHHLPVVHHALWADHLRRGALREAYQASLQYRDTGFFWRHVMQIACLGLLGRGAEAAELVAELLRDRPAFERRGRDLVGKIVKFRDLRERVVEGLARSGLRLE